TRRSGGRARAGCSTPRPRPPTGGRSRPPPRGRHRSSTGSPRGGGGGGGVRGNGPRLGRPGRAPGWGGSGGPPRSSPPGRTAPGGDDRLAGLLTSLRAHRRAAFVVAIVGSLDHVELDALGALTAHGTVVMVATRPGSQSPPALLTWSGLVVVDASRTPFPTA